jgi:hypothetical protein
MYDGASAATVLTVDRELGAGLESADPAPRLAMAFPVRCSGASPVKHLNTKSIEINNKPGTSPDANVGS